MLFGVGLKVEVKADILWLFGIKIFLDGAGDVFVEVGNALVRLAFFG